MQPSNQQMLIVHPGVVISNTLATVWIAYHGSVVKCARSQVRQFREDDEAAHEHVTEHMRKLGERPQQHGDFQSKDITGQGEPPVDSPPVPGRKHNDQTPNTPAEKNQWKWSQTYGEDCEGKHELSVRTNQPHRIPTLPQILHDKRQRETMMTREDKSMSLKHFFDQFFKTKLPVLNPVSSDMETRNDEIAADIPLSEEPAEMKR